MWGGYKRRTKQPRLKLEKGAKKERREEGHNPFPFPEFLGNPEEEKAPFVAVCFLCESGWGPVRGDTRAVRDRTRLAKRGETKVEGDREKKGILS